MLVKGIKSRPTYNGITLNPAARKHLVALEAEGAEALLEQSQSANSEEWSKSEILFVATSATAADYEQEMAALKANNVWQAPTIPILLNRLSAVLSKSHMGTCLYVSGTEGFIGQVMQVAMNHGIDPASIKTEHRGSEARRVQCVHCKGFTDNVRTSPYNCPHCGLSLLVRDHYSRRLGAFQGVCIDAEEPGTAPTPEVMFP